MFKGKSSRSNVQTILPLDALLKEKENTTSKPTASRSAGKVGKWGVTSFTSIRTAYTLGLQTQQDFKVKHSEIDQKPEQEPEPISANKPRKFFKSRASIQAQGVQTTFVHPIDVPVVKSVVHSEQQRHKTQQVNNNKKVVNNKSSSSSVGKQVKAEKKGKKPKKSDIKPERAPERTSTRTRNKHVNYNEDDSASVSSVVIGESKIIEANASLIKEESAPQILNTSKTPPPTVPEFQIPVVPEVEKPEEEPSVVQESPAAEHPKIVLRISKGRLVGSIDEEPPIKMASPQQNDEVKEKKSKKKTEQSRTAPVISIAADTEVDELEQQLAEIVHEDLNTLAPVTLIKTQEPEPIVLDNPPPAKIEMDNNVVEPKRTLRTRNNVKRQKTEKEEPPPAPITPVKSPPATRKQATPRKATPGRPKAVPKTTPAKKIVSEKIIEKAPSPPPPEKPIVVPETKSAPIRNTRATRKRKGAAEIVEVPIEEKKKPEVAVPETIIPEKKRHVEEKIAPPKSSPNIKCKIKVPPKQPTPEKLNLVAIQPPIIEEEITKPSVKLVISKKKGSIFKSRALVNETEGGCGNKRHVYKHKWEDDDKEKAVDKSPDPKKSDATVSTGNHHKVLDEFDDDFDDELSIKDNNKKKTIAKSLIDEFSDEIEPVDANSKKGKKVRDFSIWFEINI